MIDADELARLRESAERFPPAWQALRLCAAESAALRARVAKLEAALEDVRIDFEMWHETTSIAKIDAALKDAP